MKLKATQRPNFRVVQRQLHAALTGKILAAFYSVYQQLGGGFVEPVYVDALATELTRLGLKVRCQAPITIRRRYRPVHLFRADLLVNDVVLIEIRARAVIAPAHEARLLACLRATTVEVGLLLNFGPEPRFRRLVFPNQRTKPVSLLRH